MLIRSPHELLRAGQVQGRILPATPSAPGYEFVAHYQPAYSFGGDYYDLVPLPHDRLGVAVGVVAAKGAPAALMMARFAAETRHRLRAPACSTPAPAISRKRGG